MRDLEREENKKMMSKLMEHDNKDELKRQIYSKKQQNLNQWKEGLQQEKDIINAQMSKIHCKIIIFRKFRSTGKHET